MGLCKFDPFFYFFSLFIEFTRIWSYKGIELLKFFYIKTHKHFKNYLNSKLS